MRKNGFPLLIVLLNALPLYGVFAWDWRSFDLIFLYWFENLIIGVFMILRMLLRPYKGPAEAVARLFTVPFFTVHYGLFCTVHGLFVIELFSGGSIKIHDLFDVYPHIWPVLQHNGLFLAALALIALQLADWIRDSIERGWGNDKLAALTIMPYQRIVILHITIIASGFALSLMNEPVAGLIMLIALKTGFDIASWRKSEQRNASDSQTRQTMLNTDA